MCVQKWGGGIKVVSCEIKVKMLIKFFTFNMHVCVRVMSVCNINFLLSVKAIALILFYDYCRKKGEIL